MEFEWDLEKAESNLKKHGIAFGVAIRVFDDPSAFDRLDEDVHHDEQRWISVGMVRGEEIAVVYTLRDGAIRLISARGAERHERDEYWENR